MLDQQYPEFTILIVLFAGISLAFFNRYHAFLFGTLCLSSLNNFSASNTRTSLGPYFNLYDAIIVVLVFCFVIDLFSKRKYVRFAPKIILLLLIAILIGFIKGSLESSLYFSVRYEVLRELRWALNLPILVLVAANFIDNEERAIHLLKVLFIGGVIASLQHFLIAFDAGNISATDRTGTELIRNIGFGFSPVAYFVVAAIVKSKPVFGTSSRARLFWGLGIALFCASVIFNQSRSLWIAVAVSPWIIALIIRETRSVIRITMVTVTAAVFFIFLLPLASPQIGDFVENVLFWRLELLTDQDKFDQTSITRKRVFEVEGRDWLEGDRIFGNGFAYHYFRYSYGHNASYVAWGHLGYIAYLSRFGLFGFIAYAIALPSMGIWQARRIYLSATNNLLASFALLACTSFVVDGITFAMSGSYLSFGTTTPSLLFGAVFGFVKRSELLSAPKRSPYPHLASYPMPTPKKVSQNALPKA